jgi:hypothetical protein
MFFETARTSRLLLLLLLTGCGGGSGAAAAAASNAVSPPVVSQPGTSVTPVTPATTAPGATTSNSVPGSSPTIAPNGTCPTAPPLIPGTEYSATVPPFNCRAAAWNIAVSQSCSVSSGCIASWSQTVVNNTWQNGNECAGGECTIESGGADTNTYYAKTTDPTINLACTSYCDKVDYGGYPSQIKIPAVAEGASGCNGGGDSAMQVIQPDGTDIELGYVYQCGTGPNSTWTNGATLTVGAAAVCGTFTSGTPGFLQNNVGPSASGRCFLGGALRADEILSNSITHALSVTLVCGGSPGGSTWQYPAVPQASTNNCTNGPSYGPPLGARLWWDEPCSTTSAQSLTITEKYIFCTANKFGFYFTDDIGGATVAAGLGIIDAENDLMFTRYGNTNPFSTLPDWSSYLNGGVTVYTLTSHNMSNGEWNPFQGHIGSGDVLDPLVHWHWLNPCSSQGTC